jgi:hypothetical protein
MRAIVAITFLLAGLFAVNAQAAAASEADRIEARDHFDRGLRLFNQLDNDGALAEFLRAYALAPHNAVLLNIGLVYAAMGRPVEAKDAFDRLLAQPDGLSVADVNKARESRERQSQRIAEVDIESHPVPASIEVDGVEAGRTPFANPLRLSQGKHIIAALASGYVPLRKEVTLNGSERTRVAFDLVASEGQLAHLVVQSTIPKLDLYLDGEFIAQTPLTGSLAVAPGRHRLEAKRPGYRSTSQTFELGAGSNGTLLVQPEVDTNALPLESGELSLLISEPNAAIAVDGSSIGPYTAPLKLMAGEHTLRVEHADFYPVERRVFVVARARSEYAVDLKPTPQKLDHYRAVTLRRRTWGWVATGTGAALVSGAVGFLVWNHGEKSDRKAAFDAQVARAQPGGACDPAGLQAPNCRTELTVALDNLDEARGRDVFGWVALGVGGAGLGAGLILLLGNDDPNRYDPKPQSDIYQRASVQPKFWLGRNTGGVGLVGDF